MKRTNRQSKGVTAAAEPKQAIKKLLTAAGIFLLVISGVWQNYTDGDSKNPDISYTGTAANDISFRNSELLNEHFQKHGVEMGFSSASAYEEAAREVVQDSNSLHKIEAEDGDDVYYLKSTNEFVIVSTDGYIRTYFKPEDGIAYFNRQ